jgi:bacterioferritin-associated ferredoxin
MIVCHCYQVTDRSLRHVIDEGACCPERIAEACGAGSGCGGCRPVIEELLGSQPTEPLIALRSARMGLELEVEAGGRAA